MRLRKKDTEKEHEDAYPEEITNRIEIKSVATVCPRCGSYCHTFHGVLTRFREYLDSDGKNSDD